MGLDIKVEMKLKKQHAENFIRDTKVEQPMKFEICIETEYAKTIVDPKLRER